MHAAASCTVYMQKMKTPTQKCTLKQVRAGRTVPGVPTFSEVRGGVFECAGKDHFEHYAPKKEEDHPRSGSSKPRTRLRTRAGLAQVVVARSAARRGFGFGGGPLLTS